VRERIRLCFRGFGAAGCFLACVGRIDRVVKVKDSKGMDGERAPIVQQLQHKGGGGNGQALRRRWCGTSQDGEPQLNVRGALKEGACSTAALQELPYHVFQAQEVGRLSDSDGKVSGHMRIKNNKLFCSHDRSSIFKENIYMMVFVFIKNTRADHHATAWTSECRAQSRTRENASLF